MSHTLGRGNSKALARQLMAELLTVGSIDLSENKEQQDETLSLDYLYGPARGQMFGVMEFQHPDGSIGVAKAFSCQYNGRWQVDGWVDPLFDVEQFYALTRPVEKQIKELGEQLSHLAPHTSAAQEIRHHRKIMSRHLMAKIHTLYRLHNFNNDCQSLSTIFQGPRGIPTGTGDCCAPKLLNHAACHDLIPLGITEFYLGQENKSASRQHGHFYTSCQEKCQPILGFMLCGLKTP